MATPHLPKENGEDDMPSKLGGTVANGGQEQHRAIDAYSRKIEEKMAKAKAARTSPRSAADGRRGGAVDGQEQVSAQDAYTNKIAQKMAQAEVRSAGAGKAFAVTQADELDARITQKVSKKGDPNNSRTPTTAAKPGANGGQEQHCAIDAYSRNIEEKMAKAETARTSPRSAADGRRGDAADGQEQVSAQDAYTNKIAQKMAYVDSAGAGKAVAVTQADNLDARITQKVSDEVDPNNSNATSTAAMPGAISSDSAERRFVDRALEKKSANTESPNEISRSARPGAHFTTNSFLESAEQFKYNQLVNLEKGSQQFPIASFVSHTSETNSIVTKVDIASHASHNAILDRVEAAISPEDDNYGIEDTWRDNPEHNSDGKSMSRFRKRSCIIPLIVVFGVVGMVVALAVSLSQKGGSDGDDPPPPPPPPSPENEVEQCRKADDPSTLPERAAAIRSALLEAKVSNVEDLDATMDGGTGEISAQKEAMCWIAHEDELQLDAEMEEKLVQRYVLAVLFHDLLSESNQGWLGSQSECNWDYVSCEADVVTSLNLGDVSLNGTLATEIGKLSKLKKLDLSSKGPPNQLQLHGTLATEIGMISELEELDLSNNKFDGFVPIGSLAKLKILRLNDNSFRGPIEIGMISELEELDLSNNKFDGFIPIGSLAKLKILRLNDNSFRGPILSSQIDDLVDLEVIDISHNEFNEESISTQIGSLVKLKIFRVESNKLTGSLPSSMGALTSIVEISADLNKLEGQIPSEFGNLVSLETLDIGTNDLSGSIPTTLGKLSKIKTFRLGSSGINGTIPTELGSMNEVIEIDLSSNSLHGTIPTEIGNLSKLVDLRLNDNDLTGTITKDSPICNFPITIEFRVDCNGGFTCECRPPCQCWN